MTVELQTIIPIFCAAGIPSIISGVILSRIKRSDRKADERSETARQENILIIRNIQAGGHLAEATAISVSECEHCGEQEKSVAPIKTALSYYIAARDDLAKFLIGQNAKVNK